MAKPRVAISACLLGERTRYDGKQKRDDALIAALEPVVELVSVCPEAGAGLGTPREPMHLERVGDRILVLTNETRRDNTPALDAFMAKEFVRLAELGISGFVMKSRSPSCGLYDTPIAEAGDFPDLGSGHFAFCLAGARPRLPFADEKELVDEEVRDAFLAKVRAHAQAQALGEND